MRFGINLRMLAQVAQPECFVFPVIKRSLGSGYKNERRGLFIVWLNAKNNEAEFITRQFSLENPE